MSTIVNHNMIVVEDRFKEMFEYLPPLVNAEGTPWPVTFKWGDEKELQAFLTNNRSADSPYPLIWLVYPYVEVHRRTKVHLDNLSLVIAVDTNAEMLNDERLEETYKKYLIPLFNNVKEVLRRANITSTPTEYTVVKYPNYSGEDVVADSNVTNDIWDAMRVTFSIWINNVCLKPIKF